MATEPGPAASVVIPTHNRWRLLSSILEALQRQSVSPQTFEVVVVADGCVDETTAMLNGYQPGFRLRWLETAGLGAAAARNAGAEAAHGPLLIFLDDDIVPCETFVEAHLDAHRERPGCVALGSYPPAPHASSDLFRLRIRLWWTDHFKALSEPGHRFTYKDFLTGNISVAAELWRQIEGLDPQFRDAREDYELGLRLMEARVSFVLAPRATSLHFEHETTNLERAFRRARQEGRSDALINRKHPTSCHMLRLAEMRRYADASGRLIDRVVFLTKGRLDPLAEAGRTMLNWVGRHGLRGRYIRLHELLDRYWYARGVAEELASVDGWRLVTTSAEQPSSPLLALDLRNGIAAAEAAIARARPEAIELRWGEKWIGTMPGAPGAEPWDARHLRSFLAHQLAYPLLVALAAEGEIGDNPDRKPLIARAIQSTRGFIGNLKVADLILEQLIQWRISHRARRRQP